MKRPSGDTVLIVLAVVLLLLAGITSQCSGQHFVVDHDYCWTCLDSKQHVALGAGADLLASGPWFAKSWRDRAWKRVAVVAGMSTLYELTQAFPSNKTPRAGFGFGPKDWVCDVTGAVAMEVLRFAWRKLK